MLEHRDVDVRQTDMISPSALPSLKRPVVWGGVKANPIVTLRRSMANRPPACYLPSMAKKTVSWLPTKRESSSREGGTSSQSTSYRSAVSGRFVTTANASASPRTTAKEVLAKSGTIRSIVLPNGDRITSLKKGVLDRALHSSSDPNRRK